MRQKKGRVIPHTLHRNLHSDWELFFQNEWHSMSGMSGIAFYALQNFNCVEFFSIAISRSMLLPLKKTELRSLAEPMLGGC